MGLSDLCAGLNATEAFERVVELVAAGGSEVTLHGLEGSLPAFVLANLRRRCDRQMLVITPTTGAAEEMRDDLEAILGDGVVKYFPDWELIPFEDKSPHVEVAALRLEALQALLIGDPAVLVAPVAALLRPTMEPEALAAASRVVRTGDLLDLDELTSWLRLLSFEPENQVQEMGQYARRGGIVDVFSFGAEWPHRIELFDDEVESIRAFDPGTQRSTGEVAELEILPRREALSGADWWGDTDERLEEAERKYGIDLSEIRQRIGMGVHFDGIEFWSPILSGVKPSVLDHLDSRALVYCAEPDDIAHHAERFVRDAEEMVSRRIERGEPGLPIDSVYHRWDQLWGQIRSRMLVASRMLALDTDAVEFGAKQARQYEASLEALREDALAITRQGGRTLVLAENDSQAHRLEDLLATSADLLDVQVGKVHHGFYFPAAGVQLVNDHEVFSRHRGRHRYRKYRGSTQIDDAFSLTPGDIVVHEDHGIGIYQGLERITVDGVSRDTVRIMYRERDRLFVPVDQINRVQRYTREEGAQPVLSKLGGADWERVKARAKTGAVKLAKELIELYARRQSQPGFAFSADAPWVEEMEAAFVYEETRDQVQTIADIKADMERAVPADRLLCGDVGYGKTEVAMRAAFKAACDGKQVAVLVPTTILAQQHYRTFTERMAGFPVTVAVVSRFRSKAQIEATLADVSVGKVDILIGTHRLLSKDVRFSDLGLVIVDEEHRFGVKHKEHLKHMRAAVDVLSMTATPIPRTLYMSLMGARDMSVINTPPRDRLPVHTEIVAFDEDRVAEAILREIERSGQVFFVHNRVQTIDERAALLQEMLPDVRFRVAHGQMSERELERVMLDFVEQRFDCLVSTMIIQSGLDMPNVNTILVDRADRFGLAELYQLRGRVGRSAHRAFAYLMVQKDRKLNPDARRRLRAIEEFSDLGSGFKVAMRDLEIRGAGNLLGNDQHGFIAAVGFDVYVKLLDDAISELKGEAADSGVECQVDMHLSAFLPDDYVSDGEQKMSLYRRLADAPTFEDVDAFELELRDRYGRMPVPAEAMVEMMRIKLLGRRLGASRIGIGRDGKLRAVFQPENAPSQPDLVAYVQRSSLPLEFRSDDELVMELRLGVGVGLGQANAAREALQQVLGEEMVKAA